MIIFLTIIICLFIYVPKFNHSLLRHCGSSLSSHISSPLVSWLPPLSGVIKIDFAGFITSIGTIAAYVIRDYHAFFIQAGGKLISLFSFICGINYYLVRPMCSYLRFKCYSYFIERWFSYGYLINKNLLIFLIILLILFYRILLRENPNFHFYLFCIDFEKLIK